MQLLQPQQRQHNNIAFHRRQCISTFHTYQRSLPVLQACSPRRAYSCAREQQKLRFLHCSLSSLPFPASGAPYQSVEKAFPGFFDHGWPEPSSGQPHEFLGSFRADGIRRHIPVPHSPFFNGLLCPLPTPFRRTTQKFVYIGTDAEELEYFFLPFAFFSLYNRGMGFRSGRGPAAAGIAA